MVQLLLHYATLKFNECAFDIVKIINRSIIKKLYKFFSNKENLYLKT